MESITLKQHIDNNYFGKVSLFMRDHPQLKHRTTVERWVAQGCEWDGSRVVRVVFDSKD